MQWHIPALSTKLRRACGLIGASGMLLLLGPHAEVIVSERHYPLQVIVYRPKDSARSSRLIHGSVQTNRATRRASVPFHGSICVRGAKRLLVVTWSTRCLPSIVTILVQNRPADSTNIRLLPGRISRHLRVTGKVSCSTFRT